MRRREMLVRLGKMTLLVSVSTLPVRCGSGDGNFGNAGKSSASALRVRDISVPLLNADDTPGDLYVTTGVEFEHTHSFVLPEADLPEVILQTGRRNTRAYGYGGYGSDSSSGSATPTATPTPEIQESVDSPSAFRTYSTGVFGDHFHTVELTEADLARIAQGETVSTVTSHTVELTEADLALIAQGETVSTVTSEEGDHSHTVTINRYGFRDIQVDSSTVGTHFHTLYLNGMDVRVPPEEGVSAVTEVSEGHAHTVSLTKDQLNQIGLGQTLTVESSVEEGHSHTFEIRKVKIQDTEFVSSTSGGHTHSITVIGSDVVTLQELGTGYASSFNMGHSHSVFLSGEQLKSLAKGDRVTVISGSSSGHSHSFSLRLP